MGAVNGTSTYSQISSNSLTTSSTGFGTHGVALFGAALPNSAEVFSKSGKVLCPDGRLRSPGQARRWAERHPDYGRNSPVTTGPCKKPRLKPEQIRKIAVRQIKRDQEIRGRQEAQRGSALAAVSDRAEEAETSLAVRPRSLLATAALTAANLANYVESVEAAPTKPKLSFGGLKEVERRLTKGKMARYDLLKSKDLAKNEAPQLIVISDYDHFDTELQGTLLETVEKLAKRNKQFTKLLVEWADDGKDIETSGVAPYCDLAQRLGVQCIPVDLPGFQKNIDQISINAYMEYVDLTKEVCQIAKEKGIDCGDEPMATYSINVPPLSKKLITYFVPLMIALSEDDPWLRNRFLQLAERYNKYGKQYEDELKKLAPQRNENIARRTREVVGPDHISVLITGVEHAKELKDRFLEQGNCWIFYPRDYAKKDPDHEL